MTTTTFDVRTTNLRALNSLTKYPSIPTYHQLDPKTGCLTGDPIFFGNDTVIATEKVDGTNARIVLLPDGSYLLGSREHLLYAQGDLIGDPALGIVEHLRPVAEALPRGTVDMIRVFYLELYGGKIGGAAKQYTTDPKVHGWRLFDIALIGDLDDKWGWPSERISTWRDGGGQTFVTEEQLLTVAGMSGLSLTPRLGDAPLTAAEMPESVEGMHGLLQELLPASRATLESGAGGRAEGVVFRTSDRLAIAKARFQDYERTLKRRGGAR